MKTLDFGKNKGKALEKCEEPYIIWLARHEKVLAERNRWASRLAQNLLEEKDMHEVEYIACRHKDMADDSIKGNQIMDLCPRCLSVKTADDLFVSYPCGYTTQYGKGILAKVKEIRSDEVVVCTSAFGPESMNYKEWTVAKSDFRIKGKMLVADPFKKVS